MPVAPDPEGAPLGRTLALNAYWLPLALQDAALLAIAVPAELVHFAPTNYRNNYAVLVSLVALVNTLLPPVAGGISDRLRRIGSQRRSIVFVGAVLNVGGLALMARANSTLGLGVFLILACVGQTVAVAAYQAMLPENVARAAWGIASGVRGAATLVGTVAGLALASIAAPQTVFIVTAALAATGALALLPLHETVRQEADHATIRDWHDFIVVFIARSFVTFGLTLLMTFVLYFFRDVLHAGNASAGTGLVGLAALGGAAVSSIFLGRLSDRFSRKIIVALAGLPMTLAAVGFAVFPRESDVLAFAILFGLGYGGVLSTGWALALDSMPQLGDVGRDLGIWGLATHVPAVIAPLIGAALLAAYGGSIDGYRALFALAALAFAIGSTSVLAVRGKVRSGLPKCNA
ncbi:MAG: MFS transporter [Vulcanimicrobiaceae bacterium]